MSVGLVLEGGAMRALYSAGVLDVFLDHGVRVDGVTAVSAGACFGANLLSGQRGRGLRYNKKYMRDPRYMGLRSLLTTGDIVNREFGYYRITHELDPFDEEAFERYGADYEVVVTNVETGEAEYIRMTNIFEQMEAMRASASMPFVSRMVEYGGKKYLDGGIADSIPVRACLERGYDRIVVILTRPADYRKGPMNPRLIRTVYGRYPNLCRTLIDRHNRYNAQCEDVAQLEREGRIFVIRPSSALGVRRLEKDPEVLQRVYDRGVKDGEAAMERLTAYLRG